MRIHFAIERITLFYIPVTPLLFSEISLDYFIKFHSFNFRITTGPLHDCFETYFQGYLSLECTVKPVSIILMLVRKMHRYSFTNIIISSFLLQCNEVFIKSNYKCCCNIYVPLFQLKNIKCWYIFRIYISIFKIYKHIIYFHLIYRKLKHTLNAFCARQFRCNIVIKNMDLNYLV